MVYFNQSEPPAQPYAKIPLGLDITRTAHIFSVRNVFDCYGNFYSISDPETNIPVHQEITRVVFQPVIVESRKDLLSWLPG